jgi:hypothetical protein
MQYRPHITSRSDNRPKSQSQDDFASHIIKHLFPSHSLGLDLLACAVYFAPYKQKLHFIGEILVLQVRCRCDK